MNSNMTERVVAFVASIITIVTFVYSIQPMISSASSLVEYKNFEIISLATKFNLATRIILISFVEGSLGFAFGLLFLFFARIDDDLTWWFLSFIFSLVSAWVSFFNLEFLLIGYPVSGFFGFLLLGILGIVALGVAVLFASSHVSRCGNNSGDRSGQIAIFQLVAFALIYIAICLR